MNSITVLQGDSRKIPTGEGTMGSRSLVIAGSAIRHTIEKMIDQGKRIAANMLEASAGDIEFVDGRFAIGGTDRSVSLREVAAASYDENLRPKGKEPGLYEAENFAPPDSTFPNGCHISEVEIDEGTGAMTILRHTIQDDLGVAMNPLLMEGQILGGTIQGIGQAICEQVVYDDAGQVITGSFMDYAMPRADSSPAIDFAYTEVPSPTNPLGAKGAGEAGTIGAMPAVVNAALDALAPLGVTHLEMPLTPRAIWEAISAAKAGR